jgi:predicted transcriptional regulator
VNHKQDSVRGCSDCAEAFFVWKRIETVTKKGSSNTDFAGASQQPEPREKACPHIPRFYRHPCPRWGSAESGFPAPSFPVLPPFRFSRTLKGMEVHFTPEQETQLSQIATRAGTDAERLVKDAALRLLQEEARFRAAVREGIAQADRGEFIEEEEMDARLEQMLRS